MTFKPRIACPRCRIPLASPRRDLRKCRQCDAEYLPLGETWDLVALELTDVDFYRKEDREYWVKRRSLRTVSPPMFKNTKQSQWLSYYPDRYLNSYYEYRRLKDEYDFRLIELTLNIFKKNIVSDAPLHMLDVGSGHAPYHGALLDNFPGLHITGTEIEPCAVLATQQFYGPRADYYRADACHLPFEDESFDIVFSKNTVEHAGIDMIREMARVQKGSGFSLLIGPGYIAQLTGHLKDLVGWFYSLGKLNVHGFKVSQYRKQIQAAGYQIKAYRALCFNSIQRSILQPWAMNPRILLPPKIVVDAVFVINLLAEKILRRLKGECCLWMQVFELAKPGQARIEQSRIGKSRKLGSSLYLQTLIHSMKFDKIRP